MPAATKRPAPSRYRATASLTLPHVPLRELVAFALRAIKGFRANQGFLLAGAVAYYSLLSLIPLLILVLVALS
jgi:uncharacterized BrkB/YihY/UPF0761 family membrane protein